MSSKFIRAFLLLGSLQDTALAQSCEGMAGLVSEGSVDLNFRYRFESVDQDGIDKNASASTLRTPCDQKTHPGKEINSLEISHQFQCSVALPQF